MADWSGRVRRFLPAILGVAWVVWALGYQVVMDQRYADDRKCFVDTFTTAETSTTPIALTSNADETLRLRFDQSRGSERDQIALAAGAPPPPQVQVSVSALRREGQTIDDSDVHVRARSQRNTVLLDLCVDARTIDRVSAGVYRGTVTFTDQRVEAFSVPVEVSFQARYLWWLAPLVLFLPMLAMVVISTDEARAIRWGLSRPRTLIAAIGAAGVVFGTQGVANAGWGGPQAAFGIIASMYAAATGAAVTVTGRSRRKQGR